MLELAQEYSGDLLDIMKKYENSNKKVLGQLTSWGEFITSRVMQYIWVKKISKHRRYGYQETQNFT
jgi:adenine-specific DNA methylase